MKLAQGCPGSLGEIFDPVDQKQEMNAPGRELLLDDVSARCAHMKLAQGCGGIASQIAFI
ncbi:MAG: hypothetical protein AAFX02_08575 [Pseudomonadota bacterium]